MYSIVVKSTDFRDKISGFKVWVHHLAVSALASYSTFLCLSFLNYKMGILKVSLLELLRAK